MPANLTPQFLKARERFRSAQSPQEKLAALEEMLATIPKHKGTDKMQADIKRRIARLRDAQPSSHHGRGPRFDHIDREGAGQVLLVGPPNSGKSTLLAALSNARPEVADYPYSTVFPVPGMMQFEDVPIQLVDLPPLSAEYTEPWVHNLIRQADLCLLTLDASIPAEATLDALEEILLLVEERHTCLVAERSETAPDESVKEVPARIVLTKADRAAGALAVDDLEVDFPVLVTSAVAGTGLDDLRHAVFAALRVLRIYTKLPGEKPDLTEPYILPIGATVLDAVTAVHREFVEHLRYVRVWGSGKFDGQKVPTSHTLEDKDIVEIHLS
jgi:uncharacterized protein